MNSISFSTVLLLHLHDDDDEYGIKSICTWIRCRAKTISCRRMNPMLFHSWTTMKPFLLRTIVKHSLIIHLVRNHIRFMRLHDTVFILYQINVCIDFHHRVDGKVIRNVTKSDLFKSRPYLHYTSCYLLLFTEAPFTLYLLLSSRYVMEWSLSDRAIIYIYTG